MKTVRTVLSISVTVFSFRKGEAMKTVRTAICSLGFVAVLAVTQNVYGTVILSHSGATDPTTEGWALTQRANGTVGAVTNDSGLGVNAWKTVDTGTTTGSDLAYYDGSSALTPSALAEIATGGWAMRANLRVDDLVADGYNQQPDLAPGFQVTLPPVQLPGQPGTYFTMLLGSDSSGNPTVFLNGGWNNTPPSYGNANSATVTLSGSGYHLYDVEGHPTGLVDLYVDGTKVISNFNVWSNATWPSAIQWGCEDTPGIGAGYFNSVQFETAPAPIPEPSALILLGSGLVGLLAYAWRSAGS